MDPQTILREVPFIASLVRVRQIGNSQQVAISTVLVKYIWAAPWSLVKVLFLLTRYLAFVEVGFMVAYMFEGRVGLSPVICEVYFGIGGLTIVASIALAEAIFFVRVYAISNRSRAMFLYLTFQWAAIHIAQFVLMGFITRNLESRALDDLTPMTDQDNDDFTAVLGRCFPGPRLRALTLATALFALPVLSGTTLVGIMMYLGFKKFRHVRATALTTIYFRDGLVYYVVLAGLSIVNIGLCLSIVAPTNIVLGEFQGVLYTILSCRLVLNLRQGPYPDSRSGAAKLSRRAQVAGIDQRVTRARTQEGPDSNGARTSKLSSFLPIQGLLGLEAEVYRYTQGVQVESKLLGVGLEYQNVK
ncbi:hypothetical protein FA15DRAFT_656154 [Coprinopsis marcescibilis]|uniref:DUF6533 domain-containing protein n=1 Tax=Coprinopsis marcescibilis TaxID=230819 RepID=A0A5C3KWF2_COPMA|nr:hypothetical protein FA15DRAFT_656154 [Coprinopsis marcescibilis]